MDNLAKDFSLRSLAFYTLVFGAVLTGSRLHPTGQFVVRALLTTICLLFFSAYGCLVGILFTILGRRELINWATARSYAYIAAPLVGISFKVEGKEYMNTRPAVFVCNHQAAVDVMVLGKIFPENCVVVGKHSLKFVPLLGMFMQLGGNIFLDRANHGTAVAKFAKAAQDIKKRQVSVFIFPEGTRAHFRQADLLPFKKGAFHLAIQAEIPIVPIVVANYSDCYDSRRRIFKGGQLHIKVLPPISTSGIDHDNKDHVNVLTERTRQAMLDTLKDMAPHEYDISGDKISER